MYSRNIRVLIMITIIVGHQSVFAQLVGKTVREMPEKYLKVSSYADTKMEQDNVINGRSWEVFIDKDGCKTYDKPSLNSRIRNTVDFLEDFYVVAVTDYFLHIVQDRNIGIYDQTLTDKAIDYGWIPKKDLLLSRHCLVTAKGKIDRKAMLLNTVEAAKERQARKIVDTIVNFYKDPLLKTKSNNHSTIFEVFFVYKVDGDAVLLGRSTMLQPNMDPHAIITGWVTRKRTVFWNHRIAIEPNWIEPAVEERMNKKIKVQIYLEEKQAKNFKDNPTTNHSGAFFVNNDADLKKLGRYPGEWRRFPLYENRSTIPGIYGAGAMGKLVSDKSSMSTLSKAEVDRKISKHSQERRMLNIVFVVDGTSSMGPYFKAVSNSIRRTMSNLTNSMGSYKTLNNIKFGAVVYRDYAEGDRKTEIYPDRKSAV